MGLLKEYYKSQVQQKKTCPSPSSNYYHENNSLLIMKSIKEHTFLLPKLYPFSSLFAVISTEDNK